MGGIYCLTDGKGTWNVKATFTCVVLLCVLDIFGECAAESQNLELVGTVYIDYFDMEA